MTRLKKTKPVKCNYGSTTVTNSGNSDSDHSPIRTKRIVKVEGSHFADSGSLNDDIVAVNIESDINNSDSDVQQVQVITDQLEQLQDNVDIDSHDNLENLNQLQKYDNHDDDDENGQEYQSEMESQPSDANPKRPTPLVPAFDSEKRYINSLLLFLFSITLIVTLCFFGLKFYGQKDDPGTSQDSDSAKTESKFSLISEEQRRKKEERKIKYESSGDSTGSKDSDSTSNVDSIDPDADIYFESGGSQGHLLLKSYRYSFNSFITQSQTQSQSVNPALKQQLLKQFQKFGDFTKFTMGAISNPHPGPVIEFLNQQDQNQNQNQHENLITLVRKKELIENPETPIIIAAIDQQIQESLVLEQLYELGKFGRYKEALVQVLQSDSGSSDSIIVTPGVTLNDPKGPDFNGLGSHSGPGVGTFIVSSVASGSDSESESQQATVTNTKSTTRQHLSLTYSLILEAGIAHAVHPQTHVVKGNSTIEDNNTKIHGIRSDKITHKPIMIIMIGNTITNGEQTDGHVGGTVTKAGTSNMYKDTVLALMDNLRQPEVPNKKQQQDGQTHAATVTNYYNDQIYNSYSKIIILFTSSVNNDYVREKIPFQNLFETALQGGEKAVNELIEGSESGLGVGTGSVRPGSQSLGPEVNKGSLSSSDASESDSESFSDSES